MSKVRKFRNLIIIFGFFLAVFPSFLQAQTPTDGIMMYKGQICFAGVYGQDSWDEYWEGTLLRDNGNIGTFTRRSVTGMFTLGITDKINVIGMAPWISTSASQGQLKGVSGLSDISLFVKARVLDLDAGAGRLAFMPTIGVTAPASDYLEDYAPFSIGMGCLDVTLRGILHYKFDMGLYVRGNAAYQVRGNSKIERDFYYTTHGVYSDEVIVPDAFTYAGTVGAWLLDNSLNLDLTYDGMTTSGGHDIRRQDVGFPSNKMIFSRIGANLHYYTPFLPGFGIVAGGGKVLSGRNVGKSSNFYAGLTYQFYVFNRPEAATTNELQH